MPADEKKYTLEIDPRILELLGPNLYTNIYYVLAELIANAYDADAANVYIISTDQAIRVEDDGHGMSYKAGDIKRYLNVAGISRESDSESFTKSGTRRKMGRKGVGKLAALSVSSEVEVLTVAGGEKSGFVLSRNPEQGNQLRAIPDEEVTITNASSHGSAIVMRNPEYRLHKTVRAIERNLLKIFPLVDDSFKIHISHDGTSTVIEDFDRSVMGELCTLITLGSDFAHLAALVPDTHPERRDDLVSVQAPKVISIRMADRGGIERDYSLQVHGWIGTYRSTRGRKVEATDFPDNFISLFANKKLGEFNILPVVGRNKLAEVYVVGQLHVDLFELTELPDIALSNRQGYKSDDRRYTTVRDYVRDDLLLDILRRRDTYVDLQNAERASKKLAEQQLNEKNLRENVDAFRKDTIADIVRALSAQDAQLPQDAIEKSVNDSLNKHSLDLGLKALVDSQKKRILISQTSRDKAFSDIIYGMLIFNNVPADDILYTSCDDEVSRIPEGKGVYEYLEEFFVQSYSTQMIYVLFVTSDNTKASWGALTEVGASWITKVDHKIFNIDPFRPEHPLDDQKQWQTTRRDEDGELWMDSVNADILCQKIEAVCEKLQYSKKLRDENLRYLEKLVTVKG